MRKHPCVYFGYMHYQHHTYGKKSIVVKNLSNCLLQFQTKTKPFFPCNLSTFLTICLQATIKSESPCYELQKVNFDVTNPFPLTGEFRIVLVEARNSFPATTPPKAKASKSNKNLKKVESRTDHG